MLRKDHLPQFAGNTLPKVVQNNRSFFGKLIAHGQLGVHHVLLCRVVFQLVSPQHMLVPEVIPLPVKDSALPLVEVLVSSFLQLFKGPSDSSMTVR